MRTSLEISDQLWHVFEKKAIMKFGRYGSIKKAITEAIEAWVKQ